MMIYTPLTIKALKVAYAAHMGQTDKTGVPYIFHPYEVALKMDDEISVCVALLHDVLEDTPVTYGELAKDFPEEVLKPLKLLTHGKDVEYTDYIRALKDDPCAKKVKLADIAHNSDFTRLAGCNLPQKERERLEKKYSAALEILNKS